MKITRVKQCTSVNHRSRARLGANVRAQPVTPSRAANLSLALVGAGWLAAVYGAFSQLGDPAPWVPSSEIEMQRRARAWARTLCIMKRTDE